MTRRSPRKNLSATELMDFLDEHAILEEDLDGITRSYINGVWVDAVTKRELRRYRHGHVRSIRPSTLNRLLTLFHLEEAWQAAKQ